MAKKTLVNSQTNKNVYDFIEGIENIKRKEDSKILLDLMKTLTKKEPKIWGKSIIGFGKYSYQRINGDEFEWFNVGFSPSKQHLSVYCMFDLEKEKLLQNLGTFKNGRGCLYIKKLEDVNLEILKQLIIKSDRWKRD